MCSHSGRLPAVLQLPRQSGAAEPTGTPWTWWIQWIVKKVKLTKFTNPSNCPRMHRLSSPAGLPQDVAIIWSQRCRMSRRPLCDFQLQMTAPLSETSNTCVAIAAASSRRTASIWQMHYTSSSAFCSALCLSSYGMLLIGMQLHA